VSNEQMTYRDLLELVELIKSSSDFKEFHLKMGDLEVDLARGGHEAIDAAPPEAPSQASRAQRPAAAAAPSSPPPSNEGSKEDAHRQRHGHIGGGELVVEPQTPQSGAPGSAGVHAAPLGYPPGAVLIKSPMVGTFYRAPEPGARPFVEVGQAVEAGTTVCIIEVMKLMNSIPAERKGTVTHILVEDGDPVEYGQVLMVLDPD
jgi:acetyl-CoA carboxylase biotin carboxyl carrier protein